MKPKKSLALFIKPLLTKESESPLKIIEILPWTFHQKVKKIRGDQNIWVNQNRQVRSKQAPRLIICMYVWGRVCGCIRPPPVRVRRRPGSGSAWWVGWELLFYGKMRKSGSARSKSKLMEEAVPILVPGKILLKFYLAASVCKFRVKYLHRPSNGHYSSNGHSTKTKKKYEGTTRFKNGPR